MCFKGFRSFISGHRSQNWSYELKSLDKTEFCNKKKKDIWKKYEFWEENDNW